MMLTAAGRDCLVPPPQLPAAAMPSLLVVMITFIAAALLGEAAAAGSQPLPPPPPPPAVGMSLGLVPPASRSGAAVFAPFDAAPGGKPQRLQLAGTQLCVSWTKSDCDGLCLETAPCTASSPTWVVERSVGQSNASSHLRTASNQGAGACKSGRGCCMDFEGKLSVLQVGTGRTVADPSSPFLLNTAA